MHRIGVSSKGIFHIEKFIERTGDNPKIINF